MNHKNQLLLPFDFSSHETDKVSFHEHCAEKPCKVTHIDKIAQARGEELSIKKIREYLDYYKIF